MKFTFAANKYVINLVENCELLDLACGNGELINELRKRKIKCTGLDIKKNINANIVHDLNKKIPLKDKSFSQITCIDSLEHVKNISQVFSEVYRILKEEGIFIVSVPNTKFYRHNNHINYFTYKLIKEFISNTNFKVEEEIYFYFIPYIKKTIRLPYHIISSHFIFKLRKS